LFSETSKTAYIEMSEASGLKLLSIEELNCMNTSSFGTGELILNAIKKGAEKIILGIGGSATNDGGMGMGQALGIQFLDSANKPLKPIGKNLNNIQKINIEQLNELVHKTKFRVACDVTNPLYGNEGAANVFASQKGADDSEIFLLDQGLRNLGRIIKKQFNIDVQKTPGSGAAGGLGGGAIAFLNASLVSGIDLVKELANFDKDLENTDWIITGEGKLDDQTFFGKAITGVIQSARKKQIPVAALCGSVSLSESEIIKLGLDYCAAITKEGTPLDEAMLLVYNNLVMSASNFCSGLIKKKL
jgi:glycerate kinase